MTTTADIMTLEQVIADRIKRCENIEQLAFILLILCEQHSIWTNGRLLSIRQRVDYVDGLRIEVYPDEHPPPHFHVKGANIDATFNILDCTYINGHIRPREEKLVKWWYQHSRPALIKIWNETRPSNCSVGPILDV